MMGVKTTSYDSFVARVARLAMALPLVAVACGDLPPPEEEIALQQGAIIGGQIDTGFSAVGCFKKSTSDDFCSCTGTLIAPSLVLSAKHCGSMARFQLGHTLSSMTHSRSIDRRFEWYPDDDDNALHDLQVYHLSSPIYDVRPLQIRTSGVPGNGTACMIVGFGGGSTRKEAATVNVEWSGELGITVEGIGWVGMESAIEVSRGSSGASPPGGMAEPGDSGGPLLCNGVISGVSKGAFDWPLAGVYYTAIDTTRSASASWVTNVASNFVNEPMVSAVSWSNSRLDLFGRGTNGAIYHKRWTSSGSWWPSTFGWQHVGGFATGTPEAVTWGSGRLDVFYRGGDPNPGSNDVNTMSLWHIYGNGSPSNWTFQNLGGVLVTHPAVVSWGPNRIDVFGVGKDGRMWHQGSNNGVDFFGWESVPTSTGPITFLGPAKAFSVAPETLDLYAVGTDKNLWHIRHYIHHVWVWIPTIGQYVHGGSFPAYTSWTNLGGSVESTPAVTTWGGGRQDIFVKKTDNRLYQKVYQNNTWYPSQTEWWDLGGTIDGAPAATSMQTDWLTLISNAPNNAKTKKLAYKGWFNGSQWYPTNTTWFPLGGTVAGVPTLLPSPGAGVDLFTCGVSFGPGISTYTPTGPSATAGWTGIASLGGTLSW
jgi:hypothetical protein